MNNEDDEICKKAESVLATFICQCGNMAEENWCPSQVDMLKRLFGAVLEGVPYAEWSPYAETKGDEQVES